MRFYDPKELDIGSILKEHADELIETLELPEYRIQDLSEEDDVFDSITVEVPATPSAIQSQQSKNLANPENTSTPQLSLPTPSPTPPLSSTQEPARPGATGNTAPNRNRVYADFDEANITSGSRSRTRTRKAAHAVALSQTNHLVSYFSAFTTAVKLATTKPPHQSTLPEPPKSWKHMLSHLHADQFKKAAEKEFNDLLSKGTFEYTSATRLQSGEIPLPLMWVFTYKFDQNGYLLKL
jgi:hypothetical protein